MIDWAKHAHDHELGLREVQTLATENGNVWGWAQGMFIAGSDDFIALRLHKGFDYEPVTRHLWREVCRKSKLVVDVGAHSGIFTLDAWRSGVKMVVSVEPHPVNYSRLVLNLRYNKFPLGGVFYWAAGDINKIDMLLVKSGLINCHAAGRMGLHNPNGLEIPTRSIRLDSIIKEESFSEIGIVKIDAENWTSNVLIGMGKILELKPDLIVECTAPGLGEILKPYGYRFWRIWETGRIEEVEDLQPWNPGNNYNGTDENCRNRFCSVRGLPD